VSNTIIGLIAFFGVLNIFTVWFFSKILLSGFIQRVNQLDENLAEAIQTVYGSGISPTSEISPIQMFFMDLLKENLGKKQPDLELLRAKDGKFKSDTNLSTE